MHCIQTSGNCIRNVTADHFAGVAADEIEDPRPTAELIRQWSTLPPGIQLPAAQVQDRRHRRRRATGRRSRCTISASASSANDAGEIGYEVLVGGGLGPHADDRQGDPRLPAEGRPARLSRGDPARLQSRGPARQQVQGADQDPRPRDRHRGVHRAGRGGVSPGSTGRASMPIRPRSRGSPPISRRRPTRRCRPVVRRFEAAQARDPDFARFAATNLFAAQGAGLHARSPSR